MINQNLGWRLIGVIATVLLIAGCSASTPTPIPPTSTATSVPSSATPTPVPPTATATPVPPTATPTPVPPTTVLLTATPKPTPVVIDNAQDLIGTWFGLGFDGMYQRFNEDGTCQAAFTLNKLDTIPNVECTYRFSEARLIYTVTKVSGVPPCRDETAIYKVYLLSNGNIEFVVVKDTCGPRARTTAQEHNPVR